MTIFYYCYDYSDYDCYYHCLQATLAAFAAITHGGRVVIRRQPYLVLLSVGFGAYYRVFRLGLQGI